MKLSDLLSGVEIRNPPEIPDLSISDLCYDSRRASKGALFVAVPGFQSDGHAFIGEAVARGASAVLCERPPSVSLSVPIFLVPDSRVALAEVSARFFKDPTRKIPVIGVTGTNGKTTITYLVEALLHASGRSPAVLGTINYRHGGKTEIASHTTPESYDLQKFIAGVVEEGCDSLIMEVSSHALDLHRVDGIHYDLCIFTNLTPEHLDYHRDLEDYFRVKCRLFEELLTVSCKNPKTALLNRDDPFVSRLVSKLAGPKVLTFSLDGGSGVDLFPLSSHLSLEGIEAEIRTPGQRIKIRSPLLGAFNLSNLLAAVGTAERLGVPSSRMEEVIEEFKGAPGRLERVDNDRGIHVFVDYAHTPDALKNVLQSLRSLLPRNGAVSPKLIAVFGCGGDRDRGKRPLMGREVARAADWAVVTSDNPRTEDPREIISAILPGLVSEGREEGKHFEVEADRARAIALGLERARPGDVVVIAGKGHEDYQIIGKEKFHFDDREVARGVLCN
jgi:UDP-N-acetylmuramoyl-L-alanyl-D-glutamate--2,6-diaminopimelate ligase